MMQQSPRLYATVVVGPHARHFVYFAAPRGGTNPLGAARREFRQPLNSCCVTFQIRLDCLPAHAGVSHHGAGA